MSPEVALNRISPMLSPFISSVVRNGKVGLDATNCLRITDLKSGCTSLTPGPNCDRFKLHIPYAGETLKWDIIFNAQYPELPPDFIFGEDVEFLPDPSALQNLASWNPSNPECLLLVVKELVQQYHQFQCSRLRESSRLMFEYQTLLEEPQYGENMEIYAGKKNNWTGEFSARFLLKLPVDFSNIPTYLLKDVNEDPGEDVALLSVSFEDTEATQVYPKLYLSPRIEHALGGSSALHIPAFPGGGCLIDYVPQVCHLLTNKVQYVIQGYHKRREYIAAFLSHFGTGVVEYDAEGFTKLTLLLMWKDFCFLVHIDLPLFFPRDQPTLTFQSVYHFTNSGQLYSQAQKNYPYSPRWDGNEMAKRANQLALPSPPPSHLLHQGMPREQRCLQPVGASPGLCSCKNWLQAAPAPEELAKLQRASLEGLRGRENCSVILITLGLFQNLCPSVPGGSVCQWKALGNTSLERWPARLPVHMRVSTHSRFLEAAWHVFTAAFCSHSSFAHPRQPRLLKSNWSWLVVPGS
ncbi:BRISC and BRCA1-A complex member 2 isoform X1 [Theropithecus gelada]|uniref:BRISC and BRCA1-A complex member 2 isoform X1 n=1 Tax=Theropithecus gelada TaxID=9565 RepID=UPI0000D9D378|nr:BRISC and BRCA1-A complex member 2 isoform X1 [Theropithecus gelada]